MVQGPASPKFDSDQLEAFLVRCAALPEPLAVLAGWTKQAQAEGDYTAVVRWLYALCSALVQYGVGVGLAVLASTVDDSPRPDRLFRVLQRTWRLSDGGWAGLGRELFKALPAEHRSLLQFMESTELKRWVEERNQFAHGYYLGDRALESVASIFDRAQALLEVQVHVRDGRSDLLRPGHEPVRADPWLPLEQGAIQLPAEPSAPGKPWRSSDPKNRTRLNCKALTEAMERLAGVDPDQPRPPNESPELCGHTQAVAALKQALRDAHDPGLVAVTLTSRHPRLGRTRLLLETCADAGVAELAHVWRATCLPHRRGPFRALLDAVASDAALAGEFDAVLAADPLVGKHGFDNAVQALEDLLCQRARQGVLLALDDLQYADDGTAAVVRSLLSRDCAARGERLLLLLTSHDSATTPLRRVTEPPGSTTKVHRVTLDKLDSASMQRLIQSVALMDDEVATTVLTVANGVPGWAVTTFRHLYDAGQLGWNAGGWHRRPPDPDEVVDTRGAETTRDSLELECLSARLTPFVDPGTRTDDTIRATLAALARADGKLKRSVFEATLASIEPDAARRADALRIFVEADLVAFGEDVTCTSALLAEVALSDSRSASGQIAMLDAMARDPDAAADADFLAEAYLELGLVERAVPWLETAFEQRMGLGAFNAAAALAERLKAVARTPRESAKAGLLVAKALWRGASFARALDAANASLRFRQLSPEQLELRVVQLGAKFGAGEYKTQDDPTLIADADQLGDLKLRVLARCVQARCERGEGALHLLNKAEELLMDLPYEEARDLPYQVDVTRVEILYELRVPLPQLRAAAARARDSAEKAGSRWATLDLQCDEAVYVAEAGSPSEAVQLFEQIAEQAEQQHLGSVFLNASVNRAASLRRAGRLEESVVAAEVASERARTVGAWREWGSAESIRAEALTQLKRLPLALQAIDVSIAAKERGHDPRLALPLLRRAELQRLLDHLPKALHDAERALGIARASGQAGEILQARLFLGLYGDAKSDDQSDAELDQCIAEFDASNIRFDPAVAELVRLARERLARRGRRPT